MLKSKKAITAKIHVWKKRIIEVCMWEKLILKSS